MGITLGSCWVFGDPHAAGIWVNLPPELPISHILICLGIWSNPLPHDADFPYSMGLFLLLVAVAAAACCSVRLCVRSFFLAQASMMGATRVSVAFSTLQVGAALAVYLLDVVGDLAGSGLRADGIIVLDSGAYIRGARHWT